MELNRAGGGGRKADKNQWGGGQKKRNDHVDSSPEVLRIATLRSVCPPRLQRPFELYTCSPRDRILPKILDAANFPQARRQTEAD